jgi:Holliday junction resolvasome RuvABC endonuclease subunit
MMSAVGLDLSLTAAGIATRDGNAYVLRSKRRGVARLIEICDHVRDLVQLDDLAIIEGYSMSSRGSAVHGLAELGGVVRVMLTLADVAYVVVPPAKLKRYATGKGNADKASVLKAAWQRLGYDGTDHNEADALWLRAIGFELLGAPLLAMPVAHRQALNGLDSFRASDVNE